MAGLIREEDRSRIIGAAIEVHRELGPGFLEAVYQQALEIELGFKGIPFEAKKRLRITYKGRTLKKEYEADIVCFGDIIVELKAVDRLTSKDVSQALNYLKATGFRICLLINFGSEGRLEVKPLVK